MTGSRTLWNTASIGEIRRATSDRDRVVESQPRRLQTTVRILLHDSSNLGSTNRMAPVLSKYRMIASRTVYLVRLLSAAVILVD